MRYILAFFMILITPLCFAQEFDWIKTEGEITEITFHRGKRVREIATIRFTREDGEEQIGGVELLRLPIIGSMKSVGDSALIYYRLDNPALIETVF